MTQFLITSAKPPDWNEENIYLIEQTLYVESLKSRWMNISISETTGVYSLQWRIPNPHNIGLEGRLHADGGAITISANPRNDAIEFALWHRKMVPEQYPLYLFDEGLNVIVELKTDTTKKDLEDTIS